MERYGTKSMDEYQAIMTKKLGLPKYNKEPISKLLNNMAIDKVDYTNFFRILSNVKADLSSPVAKMLTSLKAVLLDIGQERRVAWTSWVKSYIQEVILPLGSGSLDQLYGSGYSSSIDHSYGSGDLVRQWTYGYIGSASIWKYRTEKTRTLGMHV